MAKSDGGVCLRADVGHLIGHPKAQRPIAIQTTRVPHDQGAFTKL